MYLLYSQDNFERLCALFMEMINVTIDKCNISGQGINLYTKFSVDVNGEADYFS